jgi:tRNA(Ile)-lysidine synthase
VHITALKELCLKGREGSSVSIPGGFSGRIRAARLVFERDEKEKPAPVPYETKLTEGKTLLPSGMSLTFLKNGTALCQSGKIDMIHLSQAPEELVARSRLSGDKILSGGMHKSVKKLMCDKKIPSDVRDSLPVVCDKNGILWIPFVAVRDGICQKNGSFSLLFEANDKF